MFRAGLADLVAFHNFPMKNSVRGSPSPGAGHAEGSSPGIPSTVEVSMPFISLNPATGDILERFDEHTKVHSETVIRNAARAQRAWSATGFGERSACLRKAASVLGSGREAWARTISLEMGKPITQSRAEVDKCAWVCSFYADNAESMLANELLESDGSESYARFDPLGVLLAVMPWNFPLWQVFRFAAPALMAGNTALLKHASNVPRCALNIEQVFAEAGLPEGCFSTLLISASAVQDVIDHPDVAAVTLTGSEFAGSQVAARAGARLKKSVLELGGSDPFIVLADADIEKAAKTAATARMLNTGQSCIAAKRFIVEAPVYDRFVEAFVKAVASMRVGDPLEDATEIGSMAREDLLLELDAQVRRSVEMGARVLLGGHRLDRPGAFYAPTVMDELTADMPVLAEETFGPVAAVLRVDDEHAAIAAANATEFGLGASVWTADHARAADIARRIEAGCVFVNGMVKSDPRLPFGGIKKSGYGRELSHYGIREFVNIKTVWIG
jgi:succinate-semialdehyde dehydrogenase / glutarate-semialdehyde dehydrogenase